MYGLLHYRGDVTKVAVPGRVCGESAFRIPYEVIESEYDPAANLTTVHLQHASAETMRKLMGLRDEVEAQIAAGATPPALHPKARRNGKRARR